MINQIKQFFHHLFNPHCEECLVESECSTCNELKKQISIINQNNKELINILAENINPKISEISSPPTIPVVPKSNWNQVKRNLETASTEAFRARQSAAKPDQNLTKQIEDELNASKIETTIELHEDGSSGKD